MVNPTQTIKAGPDKGGLFKPTFYATLPLPLRQLTSQRTVSELVEQRSPRSIVAGASGAAPAAATPVRTVLDDGYSVAVYGVTGDAVNTDSVQNQGGAIITTSTLELVFWGEQWTSASGPSAADVVDAVQRILRSAYLFEMHQYGFEELAVRGTTIVTAPAPPGNYSFGDVGDLVWNLIDDNRFPEPDDGGRIVYMVFMPPNTTPPAGVRGAHGDPTDYDFPFDVDKGWVGFVSYGTLDYITDVFSHELVEALSDPEPDAPAWLMGRTLNGGTEIGDACNNTVDRLDGVLVQAYWSERQKACVIPQRRLLVDAPPGAPLSTTRQFGVDQTDVLVVDGHGAVNVMWVDAGGAWRGPVGLTAPGYATAGGAVATGPQYDVSDQTDLFFVDAGGAVNVMWVNGQGAWQGPVGITGPGHVAPGAAVATGPQYDVPGQTDLFFVDGAGSVNVMWAVGGGIWQGPVAITGAGHVPSGAAVTTGPQYDVSGQTDLFFVDAAGAINVMWAVGGGTWQGPVRLTGLGYAVPGAVIAAGPQYGVEGQTDVFFIDVAGALNVMWAVGGSTWQGPVRLTGAGYASPGAAVSTGPQWGVADQTDVFFIDTAGELQVAWVIGGGTWAGPQRP